METITLNNGTVVNGHILENGDGRTIFVYLDNMRVVEGVTLFGVQENVTVLIAMNHGTEKRYEGFTEVYAASHEFGNCNLVMRKPE